MLKHSSHTVIVTVTKKYKVEVAVIGEGGDSENKAKEIATHHFAIYGDDAEDFSNFVDTTTDEDGNETYSQNGILTTRLLDSEIK